MFILAGVQPPPRLALTAKNRGLMSVHSFEPSVIDLSEPQGPMSLNDWAALYPTVPVRTISLCMWEASHGARSRDSEDAGNAAVTWLVAQRLEELRCSPTTG